ncbi:hypothetical protein K1T71_000949 [Dendrolimus kikuchii]|uniref:Uncharacterized protein n=1 Tax=Dendrolimus kikuchii TaxID=765133 RepID=A0ACC1DG87_9NEOP|nr:hypothetical protein K1T71_000949 [Dendrolimus kikuchii]
MCILRCVIFLLLFFEIRAEELKSLKQVIILSRHNVRTPLAKNLEELTPKKWPVWREKRGYLTSKGVLLEGFMGVYFSQWLQQKGLLDQKCPDENTFFIYANTAERTMASAEAFISKSFPSCNITIHHSSNQNDVIFNPVIHNSSSTFIQKAKEDMLLLLNSLKLNSSYRILDNILDYENSTMCIKTKHCDFTVDKNKIYIKYDTKPNVSGPLKICKSAIDSFIMEYYEGFTIDNVAWGSLRNAEKWNSIIDLSKGYHNVIFNTTLLAKDIARPLVDFMSALFLNEKTSPKISLLMGHDANIYTILNALGFKPYALRGQYEVTPAGGKIVFQKYFDTKANKFLLKVDYVYQNTEDMRNGRELSLTSPPEFVTLELESCKTDKEGFCLWEDFVKLLNGMS